MVPYHPARRGQWYYGSLPSSQEEGTMVPYHPARRRGLWSPTIQLGGGGGYGPLPSS